MVILCEWNFFKDAADLQQGKSTSIACVIYFYETLCVVDYIVLQWFLNIVTQGELTSASAILDFLASPEALDLPGQVPNHHLSLVYQLAWI